MLVEKLKKDFQLNKPILTSDILNIMKGYSRSYIYQLIDKEEKNGRRYLTGKSDIITSFSGIYPKDNPQIIIYASVKRPQGGSQKPLSNAIKDVVSNISKYYGNDDTNTSSIEIKDYKLPSLINKKVESVKTLLDAIKWSIRIQKRWYNRSES